MIFKSGVLDIFLLVMIVQTIILICIFVRLGALESKAPRYIEPMRPGRKRR